MLLLFVIAFAFSFARREEEDSRIRIWLEHGDTLVIDGLAQKELDRAAFPVGRATNKLSLQGPTPSKWSSGACCHPALKVRLRRKDNIGSPFN